MKIKWGALVVDGRNKIGGQVASRNRAGAYMRNKVTPLNPSTSYQVAARARLASLAQQWRSLSASQRSTWNNAVSDYKNTDIFGDILTPSGFNLFCKLNANLDVVGASTLTEPANPESVSIFSTISFAADATGGTMVVTVTPESLEADERLIVEATPALSAGKNFVKSEYRVIEIVTSVTAGSIDIASSYADKFGSTLLEGQKIFVRITHVNTNTGQRSQPQVASAIVTA